MKKVSALELNQDTQNGLDFLGNHDIKALSFPILVEEGPFTTTGLAKSVSERAGDELDFVKSYPDTYAQGGFADITEGKLHRGVPSRLFTSKNENIGLAVVGAVLDWSECHDISLITVFSNTASKGSRGPTNTVQLLHGMQNGANIGQIDNTNYKKGPQGWSTNHSSRLHDMEKKGLVKAKDDEPSFRILNPKYTGTKPFSKIDPILQNVYKTLEEAKQLETSKRQKWTLSEIEKLATKKWDFNQEQEKLFHKKLTLIISNATPKYGPGATEKIDLSKRNYSIADEFKVPIADLIEKVIQVDESSSNKNEYIEKAKYLGKDDSAIKRIVERGINTSPYIKSK